MVEFFKYHGCGNDYICVDYSQVKSFNLSNFAKKISDRHYGVGSDGLVVIFKAYGESDAEIRIFNPDGSEAEMCGNGIRCAAKYIYDERNVRKALLKIKTVSGVRDLKILKSNNNLSFIKVDMGVPVFDVERIPFNLNLYLKEKNKKLNFINSIINEPFEILDNLFNITCVSIGNPHCVVILDEISNLDIEKIGKSFQKCEYFPNGVNVEFVEMEGKNTFKMRVWERGVGETMACGTGACACVAALTVNGLIKKSRKILAKLPGGELFIEYNGKIFMSGESVKIFKGYYFYE